ncbi:MAG: DUF3800 domain-containing protein [Armatimonadota bacterium]|nr:DUF3800 domain-containing protein [Armatimonadota bacterium]
MYFVYVDESGTRDPATKGTRPDGTQFSVPHIYALVGVSLYEMNWFKFEAYLNGLKLRLAERVRRRTRVRLELCDCEIKSVSVRIPSEREQHPFLGHLTEDELEQLVNAYYEQLAYHAMRIFAVVVDKRYLHDFMDQEKLHRKAYELLIERVEWFMSKEHGRHRALMVLDDTSRQMNISLAMKHSYFQREGTSSDSRMGHIVELPMFVASELSNGVQLADLCAYNVYRAFTDEDLSYEFFQRIQGSLYRATDRLGPQVEGLKVFPDDSPLVELADGWCREQGDSGPLKQ